MPGRLGRLKEILRDPALRAGAAIACAGVALGLAILGGAEVFARSLPDAERVVWSLHGKGVWVDVLGKLFLGLSLFGLAGGAWSVLVEVELGEPRSTVLREALRAAFLVSGPAVVVLGFASIAPGLRDLGGFAPYLVVSPGLPIAITLIVGAWLGLLRHRLRTPRDD